MGGDHRDWKTLAQKAANEEDPKKLLAIIEELNKALEERENQLRSRVSTGVARRREGGNDLLFVDDEPSIRMTLPLILQERGFQVQVAANVSEALAAIIDNCINNAIIGVQEQNTYAQTEGER